MLSAWGETVQASAFGAWASGSAYAYPVANVLHLLGLVMLVGGIGLLDLRLAGAFRTLPAVPLARALTPIALAGLALMVPTGAILFAADAATLVHSGTFRWKLALIAVALINAAAFRALWRNSLAQPPAAARLAAIASLLLWLAVAALGRWIAYS